MHHRIAGVLVLLALSACGPTRSPATPSSSGSAGEPLAPSLTWCETAECVREMAAQAEAAGIRDVAVAWLGAAYRLEPSDDTFARWIDGLAQTGQRRRLAQALAEAEAAGQHAELLARYEPFAVPDDAALQPGPAKPEIHTAMHAELHGRIDEAIAGLAAAEEPLDLAHRGDLLWARGDWAEARQSWANARIAVDERGGSMRLAVAERWRMDDLVWVGDSLMMVHHWYPVAYDEDFEVTELRQWAGEDPPRLLRSLVLPKAVHSAELSADGRRLYGLTDAGLDVYDLVDGHRVARLPLSPGRGGAISVTRDQSHLLVSVERTTELWSLAGERLEGFELEGTTPTITRVYTGEGTHHDNILEDSPTWPVSAAITDDLRWVAIGGSDSKVRLFDRQTGKRALLEYEWTYEEWRLSGSNPDLNLPLDMRFVGDELVVIYRHGDLIRWRLHGGKPARHHPGTCSRDEASALVNRYAEPGHARAPTAEEQAYCGYAHYAELSDDGSRVVTGGSYGSVTRVRDTITGKTVAALLDPDLTSDHIAFADDGRIAFANVHGRPWIWSGSGDALRTPWGREKPETGPLAPSLSADGKRLSWQAAHVSWNVWDLEQGRQLSPTIGEHERVLAMADDGSRYAVDTGTGFELRRLDGTVEHRDGNRDIRVEWFAADGHLAVLRRYGEADQLIDLARGHVANLQSDNDDGGYVHAVDAAGERVLRLVENASIELFDGDSGERIESWSSSANAIAMAPDGSWLAWLEDQEQQSTIVHVVPLGLDRGRERTLSVPGGPGWIVVSPRSDELLVLSGFALTRWRPASDEVEDIEIGYIGANHVRYSADGRWLFFAGYNRVDIRANSGALPIVATVYPLLGDGWMVMSSSGAVDGSPRAWEQLAALLEGPFDSMVVSGAVAWDRFAVSGLLSFVLAGHDVRPPLPATPR